MERKVLWKLKRKPAIVVRADAMNLILFWGIMADSGESGIFGYLDGSPDLWYNSSKVAEFRFC